MREIVLTQGKVAIIDDEDFVRVSKHKWHYSKYKGIGYAKTNNHGRYPALIRMHRFILNAKRYQKVDHINRNTLDNRKVNLRFVTQSQNMMNANVRKNNRSGFKGVCFATRERKWLATTWKNGKQVRVGLFDTAKDAARAYNIKVAEIHGEYASLNKL